MITDNEGVTFAAALWVKHGDNLSHYIAERIGEQAAADDAGGVAFWEDIAVHATTLRSAPRS